MKTLKIILLLFFLCVGNTFGQRLINSASNIIQNNDFILEWTLGDGFIGTYGSSDFYLLVGSLFPHELKIPDTNQMYSVYPNPFVNTVFIDWPSQNDIIHYSLHDGKGKLIDEGVFVNLVELNLTSLNKGFYVLSLVDKYGITKNEKLIKN